MKNIHILPTDKPSRLFRLAGDLHLHEECGVDSKRNQNIYITSDEEIKEGDCFLSCENTIEKYKGAIIPIYLDKKIILTTDQDLIKDGVQAIDDEFLEWFVKNPSCEEIEVISERRNWKEINWITIYKIIIPKEEPTLANMRCGCIRFEANCFTGNCRICGFPPKEEPKSNLERLPFPELVKEFTEYYKNIPLTEKPKQETLEEDGLKHCDILDKFPALVNPLFTFKEGAKWQAERSYSEEEVKDMLQKRLQSVGIFSSKEATEVWFKQYKKQ